MTLKVYVDLMSQPCRALTIFLKANKFPYEQVMVQLRKGEHLKPEFKAINPFQRVPCIVEETGDSQFKLSESIAIFRYLKGAYPDKIADHWYPNNLVERARVDEYLEWQHLNLRLFASLPFRTRVLSSVPADSPKLVKQLKDLDPVLDKFEQVFLRTEEGEFINGQKDVSVADLCAVTELEQPIAAGFDVCKDRPRIKSYMESVRSRVGPELYDDVHKIAHMVRERVLAGKL